MTNRRSHYPVQVRFLLLLGCALAGAPALRALAAEATTRPFDSAPQNNGIPQSAALEAHRFWDRTNVLLFAGVALVRTLDYTSTRQFRERGHNEALLTNSVVDNKPLFAGIELAGAAASVALSYALHRSNHHKLERWVSIVHIGVGTFGDVRNYRLSPLPGHGAP